MCGNPLLGDGHAILCAKEVVGNEPFAVLFGDDIVDNKIPALKQLINVTKKLSAASWLLKNHQRKFKIMVLLSQGGADRASMKLNHL